MSTFTLLSCVPLFVMLAVAALQDVRRGRIPNAITLTIAASGLAISAISAQPPTTALSSLTGLATGLGIGVVMWTLGAWGGGDAKLLAGVGAWFGPGGAVLIFTGSAIAGMAFVVAIATHHRRLTTLAGNSALVAAHLSTIGSSGIDAVRHATADYRTFQATLPYAVPVLISTVTAVLWQWR